MTQNGRRKPTGMIARWQAYLLHVGILGALAFVGTGPLTSCSSTQQTKITPPPVIAITVKSGSGQSTAASTAFANPLVAAVTSNGTPASGLTVTFAAPGSGPGCTLAGTTVTTDSSGDASATCTANGNIGSYAVTATAAGATTPASFTLTNSAPATAAFAFYVSGTEPPSSSNGSATTYYALAGAVQIDASGNVVGGEQDFIDGFGNTSPQPQGDSITGGTLTLNATSGQGTLTLITNNSSLGVAGTETLGVQFANSNHARIIQFDEAGTSSGSMDRQTLGSAKGNYAFTLSGLDTNSHPVGYGGVFSVASGGGISGIADVNDGGGISGGGTTPGPVTLGTSLSGSAGTADKYGRGVTTGLSINGTALALHYYVVGPEVIRIIDVDAAKGTPSVGGPALGSAFGQGSTTFSASSLTASVFHLQGGIVPNAYPYGTVGMLTTTPSGPSFKGVVDDDERGTVLAAKAITGTYSISNAVGGVTYNGYGSLTITPPTPLTFVSSMGIYMTDPALNLEDPNSSTGGGGGLLLDLSSITPTPPFQSVLSGGTGLVIPQTDTASSSFKGNYAFGAQELFALSGAISEFDYIGQGSVSSLALSGTGLVNDPFNPAFFIHATPNQYTGVTFAGTATADSANAGRYTLPLVITVIGNPNPPPTSNMVIYQASGGVLLWQDEGLPCSTCSPPTSSGQDVASGFLLQQASLTGLPAARRPMAKARH